MGRALLNLNEGWGALASLPHQLRHAHAVEMAREGDSWLVIQRHLGHVNLGVTSVYLRHTTRRPPLRSSALSPHGEIQHPGLWPRV